MVARGGSGDACGVVVGTVPHNNLHNQYSQPPYHHFHHSNQLMTPNNNSHHHQLVAHNHHPHPLHYHHHHRSPSPLHLHHYRGSSSSSSSSINSSGRASATITTTTTNTNTPPLGFDSVGNSGLGASLLCVTTSGHNEFALCSPPAQAAALMSQGGGGCPAWCSHHGVGTAPEGEGCLDGLRRASNRLADFLRGLFNS